MARRQGAISPCSCPSSSVGDAGATMTMATATQEAVRKVVTTMGTTLATEPSDAHNKKAREVEKVQPDKSLSLLLIRC